MGLMVNPSDHRSDVEFDIAVVQFGPHRDKAANSIALRELTLEAARTGARVVLAPEYSMFATARLDARVVEAAEPLDGRFVTDLRALAQEAQAHVVAGMIEQVPDEDRAFNTVVAVDPAGDLVAMYRKVHCYDAFGFTESMVIRPGDIVEPATFVVGDMVFGLQTCFDLRFPESIRRVATAGAAHVLLLAAQWIPGPLKVAHWETLLRARAIENTMYVAAAGQCAPRGAGHSQIVDPRGVVLAEHPEGVGIATARIGRHHLDRVRTTNPAVDLRRL